MNADRPVLVETFVKVIPFQHARDRVFAGQLDEIGCRHAIHPRAVPRYLCPLAVENLECLILVRTRIRRDRIRRKGRTSLGAAARVADPCGKITDQKNHVVSELLELPQLPHENGVAKVKVRRRRVEARLDAQRLPSRELFSELGFVNQIGRAALENAQLLVDRPLSLLLAHAAVSLTTPRSQTNRSTTESRSSCGTSSNTWQEYPIPTRGA